MLYAQETFIDKTRGGIYGESPVYETTAKTVGELYRIMRAEYGRCTGKVRVEPTERAIGWVFERAVPYRDNLGEKYLREVWVTVHQRKPETTVTKFYAEV